MLIDIRDISRGTEAVVPVDIVISPQDMPFTHQGFSLTGKSTFKGRLHHSGNGVLQLTGRLQAILTGECSRCLKPVTFNLDQTISDWFRPVRKAEVDFASAESLQDSDTEELYYGYSGKTVNVEQAIRDEIVLALPQRILCGENCKGLCPQCGQDLNQGECGCEKRENKSPSQFDRLKELL